MLTEGSEAVRWQVGGMGMREVVLTALMLVAFGCSGDGEDPEPTPNPECIVYVDDGESCRSICCKFLGSSVIIEQCIGRSRCVSCGRIGRSSCVVSGVEHSCNPTCKPGNTTPDEPTCPSGPDWSPC